MHQVGTSSLLTAWLFLAGTRCFIMVWYSQNFKYQAINSWATNNWIMQLLCDLIWKRHTISLRVNGGHHAVCCSFEVTKKNNNTMQNCRMLVAGLWLNPLKTSVLFFQTTWCHSWQGCILHSHWFVNILSLLHQSLQVSSPAKKL